MTQRPAYYVAFYGQPGCLADSTLGPAECATRAALVDFVNETLDALDMSRRTRRQVNMAMVWRELQSRGHVRASFTLCDAHPPRGNLEFRALSRAEFEAMSEESAA